jgi:hypothetical protein
VVVSSGDTVDTEDNLWWRVCDKELAITEVRVQKSLMFKCILTTNVYIMNRRE